MKNIKFVAYYDDNNVEERQFSLAAVNKINYIVYVLNNLGYYVEIISPSWTNKNKLCFLKGKKNIKENYSLMTFNTIGTKNKIIKYLSMKYSLYQLKKYLLKNLKNDEVVFVYHSMTLGNILNIIKRKKNVNIILEVEELYSNVVKNDSRVKEQKIIDFANKYIFITKMLNDLLNKNKKPYCIVHGTYKAEEKVNKIFDDNKIHIVYSGTLDPRKGGAITAINTSLYLSKKYHVHILGFGNNNEVAEIKKIINNINKRSHSIVTYDGVKTGTEYTKFLQSCDIGLSTQNPSGDFNSTSFPSKILAYLSNGLRVVTIDIPAIRTSDVSSILYYYKENDPQKIAKTIMNINLNEYYDSRKLIKKLDNKFQRNIKELIDVSNND